MAFVLYAMLAGRIALPMLIYTAVAPKNPDSAQMETSVSSFTPGGQPFHKD
jgi:hypothetical protein